MSTSKSPYEIRLEILQMAKEMMDQQITMQVEFAKKSVELAVKSGQIFTATEFNDYIPKMYSIQELQDKATELYSFVAPAKK